MFEREREGERKLPEEKLRNSIALTDRTFIDRGRKIQILQCETNPYS